MSGAIGLGGELGLVREFQGVAMILGAHLPHDPLFLDHEGEGYSQQWLEMCRNYSLSPCARASIIIPKGGGSFAPGLCVISRGR